MLIFITIWHKITLITPHAWVMLG